MDAQQLAYVLSLIPGAGKWWPDLSDRAMAKLDDCGSKLEQMYFLGMIHAADQRRHRLGYGPQRVELISAGVAGIERQLWFLGEPWLAFKNQEGPGWLGIEPQAKRGRRTADFLFYFNGMQSLVVEVDGYATHRDRRHLDEMRDDAEPLPTLRLYEETDHPLVWAGRIFDADPSEPCTHCGVPIIGGHSCPPF